jgi:YD repeat-containing protein
VNGFKRKVQTIQHVYDALNRLTRKVCPDSTEADCTYDLVGTVLSVNDPTGTYGFAYDNMERLIVTTKSYNFLTGRNFTTSCTYDPVGNRLSTLLLSPYSYNALNELTSAPRATSARSCARFRALASLLPSEVKSLAPNPTPIFFKKAVGGSPPANIQT